MKKGQNTFGGIMAAALMASMAMTATDAKAVIIASSASSKAIATK